MVRSRLVWIALIVFVGLTVPAQAHVVRFETLSRAVVGDGYEKIVGRLWFANRPGTSANGRIVDLERAPRDQGGEVSSSDDVVVLAPIDRGRSNGAAVVDIPNRGGATVLILNHGRFSHEAGVSDDLGDGFLMRHGFITISLGWQFDVPNTPGLLGLRAPIARDGGRSITGLVRSDFHVDSPQGQHEIGDRGHVPYPVNNDADSANALTERDEILAPRRVIARAQWRFTHADTAIALDGGFTPGRIYELVYRAKDPVVVGLGLAAVRDAVSYFKHDPAAPVHVARAYGFGISQSGRFLRTFVVRGFDADEQGGPIFDGIMPIVSGPSLGSFDHRFAQPSRDAATFSSFFYPTDIAPFHERDWPLPPDLKVVDIVTSHEYWGRAASLMTTSDDGTRDLALPANVRFYAVAGGMHITGVSFTKLPGAREYSDPLDYHWLERSMLVRLDDWARSGTAPPPSRYPTIADATLVSPEGWTFPTTIPGLPVPDPAIALHHTWRYDFGPRWDEGIVDREPPLVGAAYPSLIPKVDGDGIDLGGLRLPEVAAPLGTYTGWNLREPTTGFGNHLVDFYGSFVPFARTHSDQIAAHDPRRSIAERYGDRNGYLRAYDAATAMLVRDGYVLAEDAPALHARAELLWRTERGTVRR